MLLIFLVVKHNTVKTRNPLRRYFKNIFFPRNSAEISDTLIGSFVKRKSIHFAEMLSEDIWNLMTFIIFGEKFHMLNYRRLLSHDDISQAFDGLTPVLFPRLPFSFVFFTFK